MEAAPAAVFELTPSQWKVFTDAYPDTAEARKAAERWLKQLPAWMQSSGVGLQIRPMMPTGAVRSGLLTARKVAILLAVQAAPVPVHSGIVHRVCAAASEAASVQAWVLDHGGDVGSPICGKGISVTSGVMASLADEGYLEAAFRGTPVDPVTGGNRGGASAHYYQITDKGRAQLKQSEFLVQEDARALIEENTQEISERCKENIERMQASSVII